MNIEPVAFDKNNNPWFSVFSVCSAIGLKKSSHNKTISDANLNDDERDKITIKTIGGPQEVNVLSETGMLLIISRSRKPMARELMQKLIRVDLPALRQQSYNKNLMDSCTMESTKFIMTNLLSGKRQECTENKEVAEQHSENHTGWRRKRENSKKETEPIVFGSAIDSLSNIVNSKK